MAAPVFLQHNPTVANSLFARTWESERRAIEAAQEIARPLLEWLGV
jgi:hypothetical protein